MASDTTNYNVIPLQPALDQLGPALEILDLFNHRNKNQHRLSKWWARFDMLRRGIRKLAADIQSCVDSQAKSVAGSGSKRKKKAVAQKERDDALWRKMETRARHVHSQLMPRAFLAFTQLAADNQFAHLGLALIGVLAQINAAVTPLIPELSHEDESAAQQVHDAAGQEVMGGQQNVVDLGVAVSRFDVEQPDSVASGGNASSPLDMEQSGRHHITGPGEPMSKRTSVKGGASTRQKDEERLKKPKKRKDEFDNLFASLESKKPSKKKRKKGDEFDDLFRSLT